MFNRWLEVAWIQMSYQYWQVWMAKLSPKDKQALGILSGVLFVFLVYWLVWSPIQTAHQKAQTRLNVAEEKWQWLNEQIPAWQSLGQAAPKLKLSSQAALMQYLQAQLKQQNLFQVMEKMTPEQRTVDVSFKAVDAPRLFRWLSVMEQSGVVAKSLQVQRVSSGRVDAKVTFEVAS